MSYSDSHIHLIDYSNERLAYLFAKMRALDVRFAVNVAVDLDTSERSVEFARQHPGAAFAAVGIHPWFAQPLGLAERERLERLTATPGVKMLGEIGLDYSAPDDLPKGPSAEERAKNPSKMPALPASPSSPHDQRALFEFEVSLAAKYGLAMNVHSRGGAHADLMEIFGRPEYRGVRGVAHGFEGNLASLKDWLDIGFYVALGYGQVVARPIVALEDVVRAIRRAVAEEHDVVGDGARMGADVPPAELGSAATANLERLLEI